MADGLRATYSQKKEYARDLIAFLAAFGLTRADAQSALNIAYNDIKNMTTGQFIKTGDHMAAFVLATRQQAKEPN